MTPAAAAAAAATTATSTGTGAVSENSKNQPQRKPQQQQHHYEYSSPTRRWLSNGYIVFMLMVFAVETVPEDLFPRLTNDFLWPIHTHFIGKITNTLGFWQVPWTMFSPNMDDQNEAYEAIITFRDGSQEKWRSPIWKDMTWYERARHMRPMDYFEKLEGSKFAWKPLAQQLARRYSDQRKSAISAETTAPGEEYHQVQSVELFFLWERVPHIATELPLFGPIMQEMETGRDHLYTWFSRKHQHHQQQPTREQLEEEEEDEEEEEEESEDNEEEDVDEDYSSSDDYDETYHSEDAEEEEESEDYEGGDEHENSDDGDADPDNEQEDDKPDVDEAMNNAEQEL